jgi:glycosyltransferase involved in cell wall biosynthesis
MNLPTLSVIIPNYNHSQHLPVAVNAILSQPVQPLEIILIDDGSTDNSVEVIQDLAHRNPLVKFHRNEQNQGVCFTVNRGIELARGDYVFMSSADDEILPGFLEKSLGILTQYPQAALSCTVSRWHYVDSGITWHMGAGMAEQTCYLSPDELVRLGRRGKLLIPTSSAIMKKAPLLQAGSLIPKLRWHCDWFATIVLAFRHGLCYVPEPLSDFNIHAKSYYQSGHKGAEHFQVLIELVELLNSPAFADVRPHVRDSGALSLFATPMLQILLSRPEYRSFINATLLRRTFRRSAELTGKQVLPRWLARWFLSRYYRASKT